MTGNCTVCGRPAESHPGEVAISPTAPKPLRAIRRMRARRTDGTCPLCQQIMNAGRQIGLVRGYGWCHAACIVIRNRQISTEGKRS